jgi:hypothetical protein
MKRESLNKTEGEGAKGSREKQGDTEKRSTNDRGGRRKKARTKYIEK